MSVATLSVGKKGACTLTQHFSPQQLEMVSTLLIRVEQSGMAFRMAPLDMLRMSLWLLRATKADKEVTKDLHQAKRILRQIQQELDSCEM